MMILAVSRRLPAAARAPARADVAAARGRGAARPDGRDRGLRLASDGPSARLASAFGCRVIAMRRRPGTDRGRRQTRDADPQTAMPRTATSVVRRADARPGRGPRDARTSCSAESDFVVLAAPLTPETEGMIDDETLRHDQARRVADQRRARPAHRRARPAPGAARRTARRRGARHLPRRAAAADVAVLRPAERHPHAAHGVVERPRPRPQRRAVLRQPAPVRRGEPLLQRRRSDAGY